MSILWLLKMPKLFPPNNQFHSHYYMRIFELQKYLHSQSFVLNFKEVSFYWSHNQSVGLV